MTGGPLNTSIIVDVSKHINALHSVNNQQATAQPGMFYRDFEKHTLKHNALLPSYPASREICTIGGMVANNSGGEKTLTYGKTERYVKKLKVILADGNEYEVRPLNKQELEKKISQTDFEGELYKQLFNLIDSNYDAIQKARPNVSKNSAGYNLWNVWDKQTFDLTQLFVGSQGTLGIITEITFSLITPKPKTGMLVIFLRNLDNLAEIVKTTLSYKPETFESYDDKTLKLAVRFLPSLLKQMKAKSLLSLALSFLPEMKMVITGGPPELVLLAEFTGHTQEEVIKQVQTAKQGLAKYKIKTHVAGSQQEVEKYWTIRRESFNLLRNHTKHKRTAPFIDDIVVRPEQLPEFLPRLDDIMDDYKITYTIAGHIGDANFHIIPLMDPTREDFDDIIEDLSQKTYNLVLEFNGSITGEHNDGLIRSHWLKKMYGEKVYSLFEQTKQIFDPKNIFNPGKKVHSTWEFAEDHLIDDLE